MTLTTSAEAMQALPDLGPAPELVGITDWLNTEPTTIAELRGNVVLVHFWTFGCINCVHVQPHVKAWHDRYRDQGLVVLGVHTPELAFERDIDNVRSAVANAGIRYPVAFDPAFRTWDAYGNRYWPAFYFVDRRGHVRHTHYGEGDYASSARVIETLLAEPGVT
jgi:thiol-disulfide isomerase/thioredoxin